MTEEGKMRREPWSAPASVRLLALLAAYALALLLGATACSDDSGGGGNPFGTEGGGQTADASTTVGKMGEPCKSSSGCAGGVCLTTTVYFGHSVTFDNGYCTQKCSATKVCEGKDYCQPFLDATGQEIARYCLKACTVGSTGQCRTGYVCSSAGYCVPKNFI
jgi:hypothetical protein